MTSLTDIDGNVFAYEFDCEGNRLSQSLNDCLSKRFVYDGADVLLELNPTNGVAYAWVNGPGIDQPIERLLYIDGAPRARLVFHSDALGSIAALTDPDGLVTQTYAYSAFGSLRSSSGPDLNRVTYTAREQLGDSQGWMYYRYRIYGNSSGRFMTIDPLAPYIGAGDYLYVANAPVHMTDTFGLFPDSPTATILAAMSRGDVATIQSLLSSGALTNPRHIVLAQNALSRANKIVHIFGSQKHNFDPLLKLFAYDAHKALLALESEVCATSQKLGISEGGFEFLVSINQIEIMVRGRVINGVPNLGTAWIP